MAGDDPVKSTAAPWEQDLPSRGVEAWADRVDVAVVGGGIAGLGLAAFLAEGGAHVALFEAGERFGGLVGRGLGLARPGLTEHCHRIVAGLGLEDSRELIGFSLAALDHLGTLAGESTLAAMGPEEGVQLPLAGAAWADCGLPISGIGPAEDARVRDRNES